MVIELLDAMVAYGAVGGKGGAPDQASPAESRLVYSRNGGVY